METAASNTSAVAMYCVAALMPMKPIGDDHATDDGIDHLASSTEETRAADNRRRDGLENEVAAVDPVGDAPESRGVDESRNSDAHAGEGKRHEKVPFDVDAGAT